MPLFIRPIFIRLSQSVSGLFLVTQCVNGILLLYVVVCV